MAWMLRSSSALVLIVGVQLFVFTEHTAVAFAFTIEPSITAAFLGANYWGSVLLELLASREARWVDARPAVPGVLVFTALTFAETILKIVDFRLESPLAWAWIAVYAIVPPTMGFLLWRQHRAPGSEPVRAHPLARWLQATLATHALLLCSVGVLLLLGSARAESWWPWPLDPRGAYKASHGPYVGCWLVGIGVVAGQAAWENDLRRLRGALPSYAAIAALQLVTLARYHAAFAWRSVGGGVFLGVVVSALVVGVVGTIASRRLDAAAA